MTREQSHSLMTSLKFLETRPIGTINGVSQWSSTLVDVSRVLSPFLHRYSLPPPPSGPFTPRTRRGWDEGRFPLPLGVTFS